MPGFTQAQSGASWYADCPYCHRKRAFYMLPNREVARVARRRRSGGRLSLSTVHPTRFPAGPLKFRTSGFPQYGFKRPLLPESAAIWHWLKGTRLCPSPHRVGSDIRGGLQGLAGIRHRVLSVALCLPWVVHGSFPRRRLLLSAGSSVLPPDRPGSVPRPDFTSPRLYRPPCSSRVLGAGSESFPALRDVLCDRAAAPVLANSFCHRFD